MEIYFVFDKEEHLGNFIDLMKKYNFDRTFGNESAQRSPKSKIQY